MRESVIHSTANGNLYLYDAKHEFSVLMHPELSKVYEKSADVNPLSSIKFRKIL